MSQQQVLFDHSTKGVMGAVAMPKPTPVCSQKTGQQLKKAGMSRAAGRHAEGLIYAQEWAKAIAKTQPTITIEDVRMKFQSFGWDWDLGNAAGSVFADKKIWQWVGFQQAKRPEAHARILRVWRLKRG